MLEIILIVILIPIIFVFMGIAGWMLKGFSKIMGILYEGFDNCLMWILTPIVIAFGLMMLLAIL